MFDPVKAHTIFRDNGELDHLNIPACRSCNQRPSKQPSCRGNPGELRLNEWHRSILASKCGDALLTLDDQVLGKAHDFVPALGRANARPSFSISPSSGCRVEL